MSLGHQVLGPYNHFIGSDSNYYLYKIYTTYTIVIHTISLIKKLAGDRLLENTAQ